MPDVLLPRSIPAATAAIIAGMSHGAFTRTVLPQLVVEVPFGGRPRVVLAALERHLGREITADQYLAAERRRDGAREYQRQYRTTRLTPSPAGL